MEATTNTTLTTAAAWRAALSLTCADVRAFLLTAFEVLKFIMAFVYMVAALGLCFNESETLLPNLAGAAMLLVAAFIIKRNN